MKKLLAILGMITCMVGLCACGQGEAATGDAGDETLVQLGESMVQTMDIVVAQGGVEEYAEDAALYAGLVGWQDALKDIGTLDHTDGGLVEKNDEETIITVRVVGTSHNADVELIFDSSMSTVLGITTNVHYSTGEIMVKAAMNTLIGMGTVFVVLILISLIISSFTLISKFEKKKHQKEDKAASGSAQPVAAPVQAAVEEELSDDTELVAVIAAAIAAYEGSGSTDGFVVRSIRKSNKSKWQNA